jgi:hypothetical protein
MWPNRLGNSGAASNWAIEESTSAMSDNSQLGRSGFLGKNKRLKDVAWLMANWTELISLRIARAHSDVDAQKSQKTGMKSRAPVLLLPRLRVRGRRW